MSKDAVITQIFSLPLNEQEEIYALLREKLGHDLILDDDQIRELDRRIERSEKGESRSRPWRDVCAELERARRHV